MPRLRVVSTILQRAERYNDQDVCYYNSALYVFSLNIEYGFNKLESLLTELVAEQEGRWGNLVELPGTRQIYSKNVSTYYRAMLNVYSTNPDNPLNWHPATNQTIADNYRISDHPFSVLVICGLTGRCNSPITRILDDVNIESPCVGPAGQLYPCSSSNLHIDLQSVYTFLTSSKLPRCQLRKCGGWLGVTIFKNTSIPQRPYKKTLTQTSKGYYPNPLQHADISTFYPPLQATLQYLKSYGFNPIPLKKGTVFPFRTWKYLTTEPIRPDDLSLFKNNINIGIMAPYGHIVLLDVDNYPPLPINTTTVKSPHGYHYFFITDKPVHYVFCKTFDKMKHEEIVLKSNGYTLLPPSINEEGVQYRWKNTTAPLHIKSDELIDLIKSLVHCKGETTL